MMIFIIFAAALTLVVLVLNEYGWTDLTGGMRNNLVFEARNKSYGAYEIRQKYSNRLLVAFIGVLGFISVAAVSPKFFMKSAPISSVEDHKERDSVRIQEIPTEKKKEDPILENKQKQPSAPKPPAAPSNAFVKPEIVNQPVKTDSTKTDKLPISDITTKGDSSLANTGTPPGPVGTGGNGTGNKPCIDCDTKPPVRDGAEVDKMAELKNYADILAKTIHIPSEYIEMGGTGGRLYVSFVVDENGNVSAAQIKRGLDPTLDKEVKRAITALPRWTPARLNGENVSVRMVIPVNIQVK